jgi:hypothetical protein
MEIFTSTSTIPYDRHIYKVHHYNAKSITFDNYADVINYWMTNSKKDNFLKTVTVHQKKSK